MRVGAAIRQIRNIDVQHGGTYTDPVTGKPRQFDYRCSLTKVTRTQRLSIPAEGYTGSEAWEPDNRTTRMLLAVECKNLNPSFPLVVCGASREEGEAFQDLIYSVGHRIVDHQPYGPHSQACRAKKRQSFYLQEEFVGKNFLRLKPKDSRSAVAVAAPDSDIYERWAQALSSAVDLADAAFDYAPAREIIWSAVLPAVVVPDESLWRAAYQNDGKMATDPEKVGQCEYYVGHTIRLRSPPEERSFTFSHIHFFTLRGFASFLSKMAVNDHAWDRLFDPGLLRFGPGDVHRGTKDHPEPYSML